MTNQTVTTILFLFVALVRLGATESAPAAFPAPKNLGDPASFGREVQGTLRLLADSTPEHRATVRVLFYGQSITEQKWSQIVADDLRARFPSANILIENRALGGFASQLLVRTAETDLYAFQPDLLIFYVFGAQDTYEDIIRRTRERTCAEILIQNDHVGGKDDWRGEETDPAKITLHQWGSYMNYKFLPSVVARYSTGLVDQRAIWKQYLRDNSLEADALLTDGTHLNGHGEFLMAECVKAYFKARPELGPASADSWRKVIGVGKDIRWSDGKLTVEFEGNRVDVICKRGSAAAASIRIDGKKPSEFRELYGFTRALATPGGKWPAIAPMESEALPLVEEWSMDVHRDPSNPALFSFTLTGSKTGPDGEGRSDTRFVSKSGRIVIPVESWNVAYAMKLAGIEPVPEKFKVAWSVTPNFVDEFVSPGIPDPAIDAAVTIAQGLANTRHTLEIVGSPETPISALRIYRPPLGRR